MRNFYLILLRILSNLINSIPLPFKFDLSLASPPNHEWCIYPNFLDTFSSNLNIHSGSRSSFHCIFTTCFRMILLKISTLNFEFHFFRWSSYQTLFFLIIYVLFSSSMPNPMPCSKLTTNKHNKIVNPKNIQTNRGRANLNLTSKASSWKITNSLEGS